MNADNTPTAIPRTTSKEVVPLPSTPTMACPIGEQLLAAFPGECQVLTRTEDGWQPQVLVGLEHVGPLSGELTVCSHGDAALVHQRFSTIVHAVFASASGTCALADKLDTRGFDVVSEVAVHGETAVLLGRDCDGKCLLRVFARADAAWLVKEDVAHNKPFKEHHTSLAIGSSSELIFGMGGKCCRVSRPEGAWEFDPVHIPKVTDGWERTEVNSVALVDDTLVLGLPNDETDAKGYATVVPGRGLPESGCVLIAERNEKGRFSRFSVLKPNKPRKFEHFGTRVALGTHGVLAVTARLRGIAVAAARRGLERVTLFGRDDHGRWLESPRIGDENVGEHHATYAVVGESSVIRVADCALQLLRVV